VVTAPLVKLFLELERRNPLRSPEGLGLAMGDEEHEALVQCHIDGLNFAEALVELQSSGHLTDPNASADDLLTALRYCEIYARCPICKVAFGRDSSDLCAYRGCNHYVCEPLEDDVDMDDEDVLDASLHPCSGLGTSTRRLQALVYWILNYADGDSFDLERMLGPMPAARSWKAFTKSPSQRNAKLLLLASAKDSRDSSTPEIMVTFAFRILYLVGIRATFGAGVRSEYVDSIHWAVDPEAAAHSFERSVKVAEVALEHAIAAEVSRNGPAAISFS
jgi:hypothetical protein